MVRKARTMRRAPARRRPVLRTKKAAHDITTHICVILDKSGSMETCRQATISGFNEFLGDQKKLPDKATLTLSLFDTQVVTPHVAVPIQDVPALNVNTYVPHGYTALYDAIQACVTEMESHVGKKDRVLCCIITDGQENSSKECNEAGIRKLIEAKEKGGRWTFTYIGANQDSWAAASKMGLQPGNVANYKGDPHGTRMAYSSLQLNTTRLRGGGAMGMSSFYSGGDTPDDVDQPSWDKAKQTARDLRK